MDAKKCDRCGSFYEKYGNNLIANGVYVQNLDECSKCKCDKKYELCPRCMKSFEDWLSMHTGGDDDAG